MQNYKPLFLLKTLIQFWDILDIYTYSHMHIEMYHILIIYSFFKQ